MSERQNHPSLDELADQFDHGDIKTPQLFAPATGNLDAEATADLEHADAESLSSPPLKRGEDDASLQIGDYDVAAINREYALVLWGGRSVIVKEQADGPVEDQIRVFSIEGFDHWFSNRFVEVRGGMVRSAPYPGERLGVQTGIAANTPVSSFCRTRMAYSRRRAT